jgi:hypothetical protein
VENWSTSPIETPGVAMADINGDGQVDIVESSRIKTGILKRNKVSQFYYLLDAEKSLQISASKLFEAPASGRSVDIGQIFDDSQLPDIVHGMVDGSLHIFANMGLDSNNTFLGFEERGVLHVGSDCEILEVMIANLSPCTVSLICALACGMGNVIFSTPTSCQEGGAPRNSMHLSHFLDLADLQLNNSVSIAPTTKPSSAHTSVPTQLPTMAPSDRPTVGPSKINTTSPTQSPILSPSQFPISRPTLSSVDLLTSTPTAYSSHMPSDAPSETPSDTPSQSPHSLSLSSNIAQNGISSSLPSDFPSLSPSDIPSGLPTTASAPRITGVGEKEPQKENSRESGSSDEVTATTSTENQDRSWQVALFSFSSITVAFLIVGLATRSVSRREQKRQDRIIQVYTNTSMVPFGGEGLCTQDSPSIVSVYFMATPDEASNGEKGDLISPTNVDVGRILAQALTPLSELPVRSGCVGSILRSPTIGRNSAGCNTFWDNAYTANDLACETTEEDTVFLLCSPNTSPSKRKSD